MTSSKTAARKSLGQHFLSDMGTASRILKAADLTEDDVVIEIGPGRGVLTKRLVTRVKRVIAVELDSDLVATLPARMQLAAPESKVPPKSFRPPPKVTSAVVRLSVLPEPAGQVASEKDFFTLVRAGFSSPRKQIRNSLSHGLQIESVSAGEILKRAGVDVTRRPQTLDIAEWVEIYKAWDDISIDTQERE